MELMGTICTMMKLLNKGVLPTKYGTGNASPESLELSIHTTLHFYDTLRHISTLLKYDNSSPRDTEYTPDRHSRSSACVKHIVLCLRKKG